MTSTLTPKNKNVAGGKGTNYIIEIKRCRHVSKLLPQIFRMRHPNFRLFVFTYHTILCVQFLIVYTYILQREIQYGLNEFITRYKFNSCVYI